MQFCCKISVGNYVIALLFFALIMQIVLLPLSIKQQKSSVLMAKIKPKENAIRKKYNGRKDRDSQNKMSMEINDLYKKEGYNAYAGCLPLLIQLPIIIALFAVVRQPIWYNTDLKKEIGKVNVENVETSKLAIDEFYERAVNICNIQLSMIDEARINTGNEKLLKNEYEDIETAKNEMLKTGKQGQNQEMYLSKVIDTMSDKFLTIISENDMKFASHEDFISGENGFDYESDKELMSYYSPYAPAGMMRNSESLLGSRIFDRMAQLPKSKKTALTFDDLFEKYDVSKDDLPNFKLFGDYTALDTPSVMKFDWLLIIPLLVFLSSFLSGVIMRKYTVQPAGDQGGMGSMGGMNGFMKWGMPLMSLWFSFSFSVAVGLYWIYRSVIATVQQIVLAKIYPVPRYTESEMKAAEEQVRKAKKRKKVITIEVDEDDHSFDEYAISEERAEKLKKRREKEENAVIADFSEKDEKDNKTTPIEKAKLKDDNKE